VPRFDGHLRGRPLPGLPADRLLAAGRPHRRRSDGGDPVAGLPRRGAGRRRLVRLAETGQLGCSLGLLFNATLGRPHVWPVFVLAGAIAGFGAIQRPALQGLVPRLVDRDELTAAGAIDALVRTVGMIGGPAFAGVLLAGPGLRAAYGLDAATFAVSLLALTMMRAVPPPPEAERPSLRRVVEGLRYARSRPELIGTYLIDMAAMFFGMPMALFPALAVRYGGS